MKRPTYPRGPVSADDLIDTELLGRLLPRLIKYFLIAAAVLWVISGIYMVGPGERGLVLTFGRLTTLDRFRLALPLALSIPITFHC
jgi:regulator of protease activity HflC (stomatin/prohibitin superfamily)